MQIALRPYIIAGAAIAGASLFVVAPAAPKLPDVQVPAVQPAGSELNDFNMQEFLGVLANQGNTLPAREAVPGPSAVVPEPPAGAPDLGGLPSPVIAPPDLGPLDLSGVNLGGAPGPSNPPVPTPPDGPPAS